MPITRSVSTNIWTHPGIADLPPLAKLVYFFLYVNPDSDKCGCVKLSERLACATLCLTVEQWEEALGELGHIVRKFGETFALRSWIKHNCTNDKWKAAALKELDSHPPVVRTWVKSEGTLPLPYPNPTLSSSSSSSSSKSISSSSSKAVAKALEEKKPHAHACESSLLTPTKKKRTKSQPGKITLSPEDVLKTKQVEELFRTWRSVYWGDQSSVRLTAGRDKILRYHLDAYGFELVVKAIVGLSFDRWLSEKMKEGGRHHVQLPQLLRDDERIDEGVALFDSHKVQAAPLLPVSFLLEKVRDWKQLSQWKILDRLIDFPGTIDLFPEPDDSPTRYRGFALEVLQAYMNGGIDEEKKKDVRTRWTGGAVPQPPGSMEETAESLVDLMGRLGG